MIITASAAGALLATSGGPAAPWRTCIVLWFLLACPGMAFVWLLAIGDQLAELTIAIALSIALDALVSETMMLTKTWSLRSGLAVLVVLSVIGAATELRCAAERHAVPLEQ